MKFLDLTGQRFGRLLVIAAAPKGANKRKQWRCLCDCGVERSVEQLNLRSGNTKSCGCWGRERVIAALKISNTKHGQTRKPTWRSWDAMVGRCHRASDSSYHRYGARGIAVCERWRNSFADFLADMGERPKGTTLDRIDGANGYEPGNCRWATWKVQQNNRKSNAVLEAEGRSLTVSQWADVKGVPSYVLYGRLKQGWPIERVLNEPARLKPRR